MELHFIIISLAVLFICAMTARSLFINAFKIAYYEQKMANASIDFERVKNIGFIEILKL